MKEQNSLVSNPVAKAYIFLFVVYLIWGTTLGSMHIAIEHMPWILLPCLRFLLAGLLLVGFCMAKGEKWPDSSELKKHFITGMLLFAGGNTVVCWAIKHMTTGLGGLMVATTPFWMVGLSAVMPPRERVSPMALMGISIGFAGMMILLSPQLSHPENTTALFWFSLLAMLVNTFSWSFGSIYARKNPTSASLLMSVGLQNLFSGFLLIPVCAAMIPDWQSLEIPPASWMALGYLVLFGTIIATPCYLYVLRTLPVSVSSTFAYVTPVLTVLFGWLFLREQITNTTILGASVILSGVILVQWVNQHKISMKTTPLKGAPAQCP